LGPLNKQGIINYVRSILNGNENLYYPVNVDDIENLSSAILPLTEDGRLIINKSYDEKKVLEESFRTIIEQRSKEGGDENSKKYKIIDIDGSELSISDLLERYFFSDIHPSSCSVILQKFHNNTIEHYSIVDGEQIRDVKKEKKESQENSAEKGKTNETISSTFSTYKYSKEDIDTFFTSDNGQTEEHSLEDSLCRPLIGIRDYKPFFKYCKICPKVEFLYLKSMEDHIRLADSEKHKAKLLELLAKELEN
jgi:hypothetical protein